MWKHAPGAVLNPSSIGLNVLRRTRAVILVIKRAEAEQAIDVLHAIMAGIILTVPVLEISR
jgi:hypothetical protein